MQFTFTDKQRALYDSIVDFVSTIEGDQKGNSSQFSFEKWKAYGAVRLPGFCISEQYGGAGFDAVDACVGLEALGYASADNGFNFSLAAHLLACAVPIARHGSEEMRKHFLPLLSDGTLIACNAMTESETGSDAYSLKSSAEKKDQKYTVRARKNFVTNAPVANVALVYVMTEPSKGFYGGISAFLLNKKQFSFSVPYKKVGLHSSPLSELIVQTEATTDQLIGKPGSGGVMFADSMNWERTLLASIHIGTMRRIIANCRQHCLENNLKDQHIHFLLADMALALETARLLVYRAANSIHSKHADVILHASMAKYSASEALHNLCQFALRITGNHTHFLQEAADALASKIYSGTNEIQKNIIASLIR